MMDSIIQKNKITQQQFEDRLNQIVKVIKLKQQICLQLIQYLQHIVNNKQQLSQLMFLQDEISKHKIFLQKINKKYNQITSKQNQINSFYNNNLQLLQNQKSLIRRVSARILQLFQSFNQKIQKFNHFQKQITLHYKLIKPKFIRLINIIDKNGYMENIHQLANLFFNYLTNKYNNQILKINKIVQLIQNGQVHLIQTAYVCQHCKQLQKKRHNNRLIQNSKTDDITKPNETKSPTNKISLKSIQLKSQQINEQKYFSRQKQKINQKLKILRLQAKNKQKIKKQRTKFANKYYSLYQNAMDINKNYLIQQLINIQQKQHKQKILTQMQNRNKFNINFINQYIQQCQNKNMIQKIYLNAQSFNGKNKTEDNQINFSNNEDENHSQNVYHQQSEYDLIIQKDSHHQRNNLNQNIILIDPIQQLKSIEHSQTISFNNQQRAQIKSFRITNPNKKNMIPTPKSNPNLFSIKQINQIGQSYNFVKINMKNAQNQRARLPDISNRMFSMDQKHKSIKIIDKQDNYISSNNNLLIIKTSLNKPVSQAKKQQKKKKIQQNNYKMQNGLIKNSDKILQKKNEGTIPNPISRNHKKVKRSQSGNKIIIQNNQKTSLKNLQINYSTSISKKIKNFCQVIAVKAENNNN